ncbi:M20 aminoacylase family protein [Comamonas humi]
MPIIEAIAANPEFRRIRRDLHAHPELGFQEERTSSLVAECLERWGFQVTRYVGGTGVVGTLARGTGRHSIGLRADMDALPMQEANTFEHRSRHDGRMHACGHDGHTAVLLAAAWYLASSGDFNGTLHCIFQPAEEGGQAGARAMIEDGLFERFPCDAVFGLHNMPGRVVGSFGVRSGPFMSSSNRFRIDVKGKGAHASQPDTGVDPLVCAGQIFTGLQTIIARNRMPDDAAVLSVTQFHGGDAVNVIPDSAWLGGTVRTQSDGTLDMIERRMHEIVQGSASAYGCAATLNFERSYPALVNDPQQTAFATEVMREIAGAENVDANAPRLTNSEDFAFMLQARPGCYVLLGNGKGEHRLPGHGPGPCLVHNPSYDFNDALIPVGASYFVRLAERFLVQS